MRQLLNTTQTKAEKGAGASMATITRFSRVPYPWAWQRAAWCMPLHAVGVQRTLLYQLCFMYGGMLYDGQANTEIYSSLVYCYHAPLTNAQSSVYWQRRDPAASFMVPQWWRDLCRNS